MLFDAHDGEDPVECVALVLREDRRVAGSLPVVVREPNRIHERIELELSLEDAVARRERVCVRVNQDISGLTSRDAAQLASHAVVALGFGYVRMRYRTCITQPFG